MTASRQPVPGRGGTRAALPASEQARASGFFVLRTPLLPLSAVTDWGNGLEAAGRTDDALLEDAVASDRVRLRARLEELVTEPGFREAVFLAAPSLEAAIDHWRKDPDSDRGKRAENSLVAYLMRAAARPTPFGLFAGCTTGNIGAPARLRLQGRDHYRRHTRLDMDYLWRLAKAIEADPALRVDLRYWPNSSLYEVGDRLLYAEARDSQTGRAYHLVAVDKTPYLAKTLARAARGERQEALAAALVSDDVSAADARDYVGQLIDSQLLVADCQPLVTGPPPAGVLAASLSSRAATAAIGAKLQDAISALDAIDADSIGTSPEGYRQLAAGLADLPQAPDPARFVQVDLIKPAAEAVLSPAVAAEMLRAADIMHALSRPRADALASFRQEYDRRYGTREMPLAPVLDEETGIGFPGPGQTAADGGPLLAGLPLAPPQDRSRPWTARDAFLQRKLALALAAGDGVISLAGSDIDALRGRGDPPLPEAFEVVAAVAADSPEAIEDGEFEVLVGSAGGPSGARLLGRFCHADDELSRLVRDHLRAEEEARPDCVFAEVVHLPQGRTGNILSRPVLRGYEIPYLGRSGATAQQQLPVSDLLVSVRGDRVVLRSRTLRREVIPRLTTAHNYAAAGLGVYRFLCALQQQHIAPGVLWDWGPMSDAPFLPRVTSGRAVLSRATWNLRKPELAAFAEAGAGRQFRAVQQLRARLGLPRYLVLAETDNELLADLDNVLSVEALAHQVQRLALATLVELFPGPEKLCVRGPEGQFVHQIVVPFARPPRSDRPPPLPPVPVVSTPVVSTPVAGPPEPGASQAVPAVRSFPPGSEWLYLKLFTGPATADRILLRIAPALAASLAAGTIDSWHFIRYGEPEWHLRLRLHGTPDALLGDVLPRLRDITAPLLETGELWRTQLDTYEPEVERYGGDQGIGHAERIFHADSQAVLAVIGQLQGDAGAELRWQIALRGMDQFLGDLGLSLAHKREIARQCRAAYGLEFGAAGAFQHAVSGRFRQQRPHLERMLGAASDLPPQLSGCVRALDFRSAAIEAPCTQLRQLTAGSEHPWPVPAELAVSLVHMHVNRLLRSAQRAQELVLYEMLDRLYTSRAARAAK